jgi:hypothetical protein
VYDYQVTDVSITNPGLEYDVAPIVLFKTNCDNPGSGAEAYARVENGKVVDVVVTNPGSGYTEPPEIIFAKRYEIIRPKTPLFVKKEIVVDVSLNDKETVPVSPAFSVSNVSEEEYLLPIVLSSVTTSNTTVIKTENKTNRDTSQPGLAYVLQTFDQNKFKYEPLNINDPLTPYLGTGVTLETVSRYAPTLTIGDFTSHLGSTRGSSEPAIINFGEDSYISYGVQLDGDINSSSSTIIVTGDLTNFPPQGYIEFGNELVYYSSISGQSFINCQRGVLNTVATSHTSGDYLRLAWRG